MAYSAALLVYSKGLVPVLHYKCESHGPGTVCLHAHQLHQCLTLLELRAMLDAVCRYNVYANLEAQAAYLKLNAKGVHLLELQAAFADLQVRLKS